MDLLFISSSNFVSLSLKDLLEARDQFHNHLMNKKNVIATAIGLYRIRKDGPWPKEREPKVRLATQTRHSPNALQLHPSTSLSIAGNEADLAKTNPSDVVPTTLYLADGRSVPVCVIETRQQEMSRDLAIGRDLLAPRNLLGPGTPIVNEDGQGMARMAKAGALVRDGESYAGGVLIHCVRDACQPLHASYISQGEPIKVVARPHSPKLKLQADGVHSGNKDDMVAYGEQHEQLSAKLASRVKSLAKEEQLPPIKSGFDASKAVIDRIKRTQDDIAPRDIVDEWVKALKLPKPDLLRCGKSWRPDDYRHGARDSLSCCDVAAAWTLGGGDSTIRKGPADRAREDSEVVRRRGYRAFDSARPISSEPQRRLV